MVGAWVSGLERRGGDAVVGGGMCGVWSCVCVCVWWLRSCGDLGWASGKMRSGASGLHVGGRGPVSSPGSRLGAAFGGMVGIRVQRESGKGVGVGCRGPGLIGGRSARSLERANAFLHSRGLRSGKVFTVHVARECVWAYRLGKHAQAATPSHCSVDVFQPLHRGERVPAPQGTRTGYLEVPSGPSSHPPWLHT